MRKMVTADRLRRITLPRGYPAYDYRWHAAYPLNNRQVKHEDDHSVFTFKGHDVM